MKPTPYTWVRPGDGRCSMYMRSLHPSRVMLIKMVAKACVRVCVCAYA